MEKGKATPEEINATGSSDWPSFSVEIGGRSGPHRATVKGIFVHEEPAIEIQFRNSWSSMAVMPADLAGKVADAINDILGRRNEKLEAAVVAAEEAMLHLEGISMLNYIGEGTKAGAVWREVIERR